MSQDLESMIFWVKVWLGIAAVSSTAFPILYAFSPWFKSWLGRALMLQGAAFAITIDLTFIFNVWTPDNLELLIWVNFILLGLVAGASLFLTGMLWKLNHRKPKNNQKQGVSQ